jgi:hypothetical protein
MATDLQRLARDAIEINRNSGMEEDDVKWMSIGVVFRYAREQGLMGDDLSTEREMYAAVTALVKHLMQDSTP